MAWPSALTVITVHIKIVWPNVAQTPAIGRVVFDLPFPLRDAFDSVILGPHPADQGTAQETWRWPAPVAANIEASADIRVPTGNPYARWVALAPPIDPDIMQAAADAYYAQHPELDRLAPRSLEFVTRYRAGWSDDGVPGVEVIGHLDLAQNPGYGVPSKDTHDAKEVKRE